MKNLSLYAIFFHSLFFINQAVAEDNYWICKAHDIADMQWLEKNPYQQSAVARAFDMCKKQSQKPLTCKSLKEDCQFIVNGINTTAMWRCVAFDQMAKRWVSNIYPNRNDAAIAARDYCKAHSAMADSCYINLLTCRNLNERN